jgi:hypothetical protein
VMKEPIQFVATIPDIQSAIQMGQYGARIKLDIDETGVEEFLKLRKLSRNKLIQIVAVVIDE